MKSDSGQQVEKTVFSNIFTVPNMMSFFRLMLIPFILWFYLGLKNVWLTVIFVVISALTDILDGWVARKFKMVSEFGKLIDPVADKFTQGSLILCLIIQYPLVIALLALFLIREILMVWSGTLLIKKTDKFSSAKWYGKANTVILEVAVMVLLVFTRIPKPVGNILICVCMVSVVVSLILYMIYYKKLFDEAKAKANAAGSANAEADAGPEVTAEAEVIADAEVIAEACEKAGAAAD